MPLVDRVVADRLALEVVGDRPHLQVVLREHRPLLGEVGVVLDRLPDVEVVAPAGDLQPVVPPAGGEPADLLEGQVRPLSGEQGDGSGHRAVPSGRTSVMPLPRGPRSSPRTQLGAALHGGEHALHLQAVRERRQGLLAAADGVHQVDDLVGERVLVAEAVTRRPPRRGVRVLGLGDEDAPEPGGLGRLVGVEELQDVHVLEVERQAAAGAVDLDADRVLAAGREPGRLEDADGALPRTAPGTARVVTVVDRHHPRAVSRRAAAALVDERLQHAVDRDDAVAGDVLGQVDDVGTDVAQRSRAGLVLLAAARSWATSGRRSSPAGTAPARAGSRRAGPARPAVGPARSPAPGGR